MSSSTRIPSFSLSLRALLTFPIRICNPPPAAGSVRSCKVTPLIKVSLDDVLNKRHLPPLTLKDFEEWLVFVEGKPQYLYFLLWLKEYESRYANWLAEFGFSYYPTTSLSFESNSLESTVTSTNNNNNSSFTVPTPANINYIPPSPSLALFFTRSKKTFFDPTASPPSPYTLPYSALSTLLLSSSTYSTSRLDLVNINEKWKQTSKALFGPESHPHPHPKEFATLANHVRGVLKDSLERFATSACHNVGTRRAWCGLAGGIIITLIMGVLPTLLAFFYMRSRWVRLVGFWGSWLGGTVILSSLHGICMMIYLFGDLRQLRSFELARPTISNPRAIARARPRLRSLFTRTKEEENIRPLVEKNAPEKINNHAKESGYRLEKDGGLLERNMKADGPVDCDNQIIPKLHHMAPQQRIHPSPSSAFPSPPLTDASGAKLGLPILDNSEKVENGNYPGGDEHSDSKTGYAAHALAWQHDQDHEARIDHRFLSPQPLQLSTIISTSDDDSSPTDQPTSVSSVSPLSSVIDLEKEKMLSTANISIPIHSTSSLQSDASNLNPDTSSSSSSSDHGIVVSPAYQETSSRYEEDPWMWDSVRGRSNAGRESQMKTQATSRNTSRSQILSAVGSVVQWAISGISAKKRANSNQGTVSEAISATPAVPCAPATTFPVPGHIQPCMENDGNTPISIPSFISASADPTTPAMETFNSVTDSTNSNSKPLSNAGTFGIRSWIGGMMHVVEKPSHSRRNSSFRSVSTTRYSKYQSRFGASLIGVDSYADGTRRVSRTSRWSHVFGFGTRSVPEESVFEESESSNNASPLMSVAAHAHTCACPEEYRVGNGVVTQSHDQSKSQAQTIASFYAPPRVSMLVPHTALQQDLTTTPIDQHTAAFISREYAAEVLSDLESVPQASLSIRTSNEQNAAKDSYRVEKGEDMVNVIGSTPASPDLPAAISRVASKRLPFFQFEGLPGLKFNEVIDMNVSDCPVVPFPAPSSRPARPRPPKLQLYNTTSSTDPVLTPSTPNQGRAPSISPISPALPSSQFSGPVPTRDSTTTVYFKKPVASTNVPSWHSSPMTLPLPSPKNKRSKLWFDTCPRHPEVEAKIAEAEAALIQAQAQTTVRTRGSDKAFAPPQSPASLSSTSRPSTFHSSPRVLPSTLPDTYANPSGSSVFGIKSWMAKTKHRIFNLAHNHTDSPPLPSQVNTPSTHAFSTQLSSNLALSDSDTFSSDWRERLKSVTSVPAFGPLTRVLSPLVSRGQWEIVVRSAAYAFIGAWLWTGVMVSLPTMRPRSF
ncbi:hypothetical protein Clacol_008245 [Clathrus columnatus]|uniref:RGS domain-containing protein n=1 Tax=Clathrus columnatus TaxID=1419009 RepID=A0AAV5ALL5_9AGAM|nr:hypothetical protein Clacol_008245 [Clathrus columnatus]